MTGLVMSFAPVVIQTATQDRWSEPHLTAAQQQQPILDPGLSSAALRGLVYQLSRDDVYPWLAAGVLLVVAVALIVFIWDTVKRDGLGGGWIIVPAVVLISVLAGQAIEPHVNQNPIKGPNIDLLELVIVQFITGLFAAWPLMKYLDRARKRIAAKHDAVAPAFIFVLEAIALLAAWGIGICASSVIIQMIRS